MAGVKGKSGGARKGAGRKPKGKDEALEPQAHGGALKRSNAKPVAMGERDMLQMLQDVALGKTEASVIQVRAAIAAVQYTHAKKGEGGKKEKRQAEAEKIAGRFTAASPPKLVATGGKRV